MSTRYAVRTLLVRRNQLGRSASRPLTSKVMTLFQDTYGFEKLILRYTPPKAPVNSGCQTELRLTSYQHRPCSPTCNLVKGRMSSIQGISSIPYFRKASSVLISSPQFQTTVRSLTSFYQKQASLIVVMSRKMLCGTRDKASFSSRTCPQRSQTT